MKKMLSKFNWIGMFILFSFTTILAQTISYEIGELLFQDNFDGDLSNWHAEIEDPASSSMKIVDGQLEIDTGEGCVAFFLQKLEGPVMIEYEATLIDAAGPNDRVADMNALWMMKDLNYPDDILADTARAGGNYRSYYKLPSYYIGKGVTNNSSVRFRKHNPTGNGRIIVIGEHAHPSNVITPNVTHKIQLVACDSLVQFICDGVVNFNFYDSEALTDGWFAFLQDKNRIRYDNFKIYRLAPESTQSDILAKNIPYDVGEILYEDNFDGDLSNWKIELRDPVGSSGKIVNGELEVDANAGATSIFLPKLEGPVMIEYNCTSIDSGGANDRTSDFNCFWMMHDFNNPDDIQADTTRNGDFGNYWYLPAYYVGKGGNKNSTTRMRKHHPSGNGERISIGEYTHPFYLIEPNRQYKIQLVAFDSLLQYFCDDVLYFSFVDEDPIRAGWAAFRQVRTRIGYDNVKVYRLAPNYSAVDNDKVDSPIHFNLDNNYPNPFNPVTNISFTVPPKSRVKLDVYNILGKHITTLVDDQRFAGRYSVLFNGTDLGSGVYFYKLTSGHQTIMKKMILIK